MKFTAKTVQILKHYASINPSFVFKKGDVLETISHEETLVARTTTDQVIDQSFAIADLNRFLGALSLFKEPDIQFHKSYLTIKGDDRELNYVFADPRNIKQPPAGFKMPESAVELKLSASALSDILKALSIMSLPQVAFVGDGSSVSVQAIDSKNPTSDNFKVMNLGETDKVFKAIFRIENIKVLPADYDVKIAEGISHFKGENMLYWIAVEDNSTFS